MSCSICLVKKGKKIKLDCSHKFHRKCIKEWFDIKKNCPNCRRIIKYDFFGKKLAGSVGSVGSAGSARSAGLAGETDRDLYIPLQFWFNRNPELSIPVISLAYSEVRLDVRLAET